MQIAGGDGTSRAAARGRIPAALSRHLRDVARPPRPVRAVPSKGCSVLRVDNLVLVRAPSSSSRPGLTAITGETGAGKTSLAQAVGLLLGGRADASLVGPAGREAYVEAAFSSRRARSPKVWPSSRPRARRRSSCWRDGSVADGRSRALAWGRGAHAPTSRRRDRRCRVVSQHEARRLARPAVQLECSTLRQMRATCVPRWRRASRSCRRPGARSPRHERAPRAGPSSSPSAGPGRSGRGGGAGARRGAGTPARTRSPAPPRRAARSSGRRGRAPEPRRGRRRDRARGRGGAHGRAREQPRPRAGRARGRARRRRDGAAGGIARPAPLRGGTRGGTRAARMRSRAAWRSSQTCAAASTLPDIEELLARAAVARARIDEHGAGHDPAAALEAACADALAAATDTADRLRALRTDAAEALARRGRGPPGRPRHGSRAAAGSPRGARARGARRRYRRAARSRPTPGCRQPR